jgi:hypothetical protein
MLSVDPIGPTTTSAWIEPQDIYPSVQVSHRFANRRVRRTKFRRRPSTGKAARDGKWEQPLGNLHRGLKCAPEVGHEPVVKTNQITRTGSRSATRLAGVVDANRKHAPGPARCFGHAPCGSRGRRRVVRSRTSGPPTSPDQFPAENGPRPQRRRLPCLSHRQSSLSEIGRKNAEE